MTLKTASKWGRVICFLALTVWASPSFAFFPIGQTSALDEVLVFFGWPLSEFDGNDDGDVSGEEGLEITLEGGDFGFTDDEMRIVQEGFRVWQNINTSFVAFRYRRPITDPDVSASVASTGATDGINYITIQSDGDPTTDPAVAAPALAITFTLFNLEEQTIETADGASITLPGGQTLEVDMIFAGGSFRSTQPGVPPLAELLGTVVHEAGHLLGFDHSPMNNLEDGIESLVYAQRNFRNILEPVGVTPTMFPSEFLVDDGTGQLFEGGATLAPDDIAALNLRYGRPNADAVFFDISQFARTTSSNVVPAEPLLGALITAWADADGNPATPRVPFVSTLTGLFESGLEANLANRGNFQLRGLRKTIEAVGVAEPFEANYVLTMQPITNFRFPELAGGANSQAFDSTHPAGGFASWDPGLYNQSFFMEVFNETQNLRDLDELDAGTQLQFDQELAQVVNALTGEPLSQILTGERSMFGDSPDTGCAAIVREGNGPPAAGPGARGDMLLVLCAAACLLAAQRISPRRRRRGEAR